MVLVDEPSVHDRNDGNVICAQYARQFFFAHRVLDLFMLAIAGVFYALLSGVLLMLVRFFRYGDDSLLGAALPLRIVRGRHVVIAIARV